MIGLKIDVVCLFWSSWFQIWLARSVYASCQLISMLVGSSATIWLGRTMPHLCLFWACRLRTQPVCLQSSIGSWQYDQYALTREIKNIGHTKKVVTNAVLFLGYCTGNIAGPFFYKTDQSWVHIWIVLCLRVTILTELQANIHTGNLVYDCFASDRGLPYHHTWLPTSMGK